MKVQYFSDIHLEFYKTNPFSFSVEAPILCLAGDIGNPLESPDIYQEFFSSISPLYEKIFVIAGNHEFYTKKPDVIKYLKNFFEKFSNISFLNNESIEYAGFNWIGSTLWSKITITSCFINDLNFLSRKEYNELHEISRNFLKNAIENSELPCIVITHHYPSHKLTPLRYQNNQLNCWFASESEDLIKSNIKLWIFGHTHLPVSKEINGVPFRCCPYGYPKENTNPSLEETFDI